MYYVCQNIINQRNFKLNFEVPILLLIFNRVAPLEKLIKALAQVKPTTIYIACDGPRSKIKGETRLVKDVQYRALELIDWPCEVHTLFREENLGCKVAVSNAVQWFFGLEAKGIVLEDDCIATPFFFEFCQVMLEKYENSKFIATISGRNELSNYGEASHIFSSKFFCWGWASWANRIVGIDVEHGYHKKAIKCIQNKSLSYAEKNHVKGIHNLMLTKQVNSWAYSYDLYFRSKNMLHILPKQNLIKNIGVGAEGTHHGSKSEDDTSVSNVQFSLDYVVESKVNRRFMDTYFKHVYSPFKLFLFPVIGYIKKIKKWL
jgi:hypothetical protein